MDWDMKCRFCEEEESTSSFFNCPATKCTCNVVSFSLGASDRPANFTQYFVWVANLLGRKFNFHVVDVAALCWAIWKLMNRACFELKKIDQISGGNDLLRLLFFEILVRVEITGG
jgi:hypothetical protein